MQLDDLAATPVSLTRSGAALNLVVFHTEGVAGHSPASGRSLWCRFLGKLP